MHLYKNLDQESASQTFNICGGSFPELVSKSKVFQIKSHPAHQLLCLPCHIGIVSDPEEGILIESFEYRTSSGFQFTVVSDSQEQTNIIRSIFEAAAQLPAI